MSSGRSNSQFDSNSPTFFGSNSSFSAGPVTQTVGGIQMGTGMSVGGTSMAADGSMIMGGTTVGGIEIAPGMTVGGINVGGFKV